MNRELLKAWVHHALQNPMDEHQLAHAEATKELLEENARYREALELIENGGVPDGVLANSINRMLKMIGIARKTLK